MRGSLRPGLAAAGALAAGAVLLVAPAGPASAHNQLEATVPADGAVVDAPPASVVLTFDQPVLALGTQVVVLGPDGAPVSTGDPVLVDDDVTQDLGGELPAGAYRVEWRATSADGHPVSGELGFTASGPGTGAAAAPPPPAGGTSASGAPAASAPLEAPDRSAADPGGAGSSSTAVALALAAAVAAAVGVVALVRRRRTAAPLGRAGDAERGRAGR